MLISVTRGEIKVWNLTNGLCEKTLIHPDQIDEKDTFNVVLFEKNKLIATVKNTSTIWDLSKSELPTEVGLQWKGNNFAMIPLEDGSLLIGHSLSAKKLKLFTDEIVRYQVLFLYNFTTKTKYLFNDSGKQEGVVLFDDSEIVRELVLTEDFKLLCAYTDGRIDLIDFNASPNQILESLADKFEHESWLFTNNFTIERFRKMKNAVKDGIYKELFEICKEERSELIKKLTKTFELSFDDKKRDPLTDGKYAFHDEENFSSTNQQKAQAIRNYIKKTEVKL